MLAPPTTNRQKYYQLTALVCEDLATTAINALVRQGHQATAAHPHARPAARVLQEPARYQTTLAPKAHAT